MKVRGLFYLDDFIGQWFRDDLKEGRILSVGLSAHSLDHGFGHVVEEPRDGLNGQQDEDAGPVEHVMDGGSSERSPEGGWIGGLGQRHDSVGHRSPDVGSHDDRDRLLHG